MINRENKFKIVFCDHYHSIGVAWTREDGTRTAVRIKIPNDVANKISNVAHGRDENYTRKGWI